MSRYPWRNTSEDISSQTPSQWETPGGAQKKADQAEQNAKTYTDQQMGAHVGKGGTAHANAVPNGLSGFMTGEDKAKLDGVQAGANNYVHPVTHPPSIIAQDANNRFVSDAEKMTWNAKATTDEATQTLKGLMSATDKVKLDGVQVGAEVNQNAFSTLNTIAAANKTDKVTFVGGTGITVTTDASKKEIKFTATGNATPGPHAETHLPGGTDVIPFATDTVGGLMSDKDKKDLTSTVTQLGQTTTTLNTHVGDNTKHITAAERNTWNAKETPEGAQAKANQAETNAKNYAAPKEHAHDASAIISGTFAAVRLPLLDSVNSTSTQHAATANAVKVAYDRAEQAFTSGVSAKQGLVDSLNAIGVPASTSEDWSSLNAKVRQGGAIKTAVVNDTDSQAWAEKEYIKPIVSFPAGTKLIIFNSAPGDEVYTFVNPGGSVPSRGYVTSFYLQDSAGARMTLMAKDSYDGGSVWYMPGFTVSSDGFSNVIMHRGNSSNSVVASTASGSINFNLPITLYGYIKTGERSYGGWTMNGTIKYI